MTKKISLIVVLILLRIETYAGAPTISSFSPASGPIGSSVTIIGTGFNAIGLQNIVYFGATQATITAANTSSLTVIVPIGATYQNITITNLANNLTAYSTKPFIVTFPGKIAFVNKQDFSGFWWPFSAAIGDINSDGKSDLVVPNDGGNNVSVLKNTSTINAVSFANKVYFAGGSYPWFVSIGDIDGDGKLDFVICNWGSDLVSVFRNTSTLGSVSFAPKVDFLAGSVPYSVSIGDIDGDGKPDLATANYGRNYVSILRNTSTIGSVSFAARVNLGTCYDQLTSVCMGDIDGDGKPDLALTSKSVSCVSVFLNTSVVDTISFAPFIGLKTGECPRSLTIGDIDGDGKPDLATANECSDSVSVFRNTSTIGTLSFASKVDFATGDRPRSICIGDVNGDGKPDMAVTNSLSDSVTVFRNTSNPGTINFAGKVDFATCIDPESVSIGDIDGDGKPDLIVASQGNSCVSILKQVAPPMAIISGGGTVCKNTSLPNVSIALTGTPPWTLTFAKNGVNQTPVSGILTSPYIITGATAGTYTVVGLIDTYFTGTSFNGSAIVSIDTIIPDVPSNIFGRISLCQGDTEVYSINNIAGASNYTWICPAGWISSSADTIVNVIVGNTLGNICVSANNSCGSSNQLCQTITVNPLPLAIINISGNDLITSCTTDRCNYQWYKDGNPICSDSTICSMTGDGQYVVVLTDSNGCSATSAPFIITGTEKKSVSDFISIFPNPAKNKFIISFRNTLGNASLKIFDVMGEEVYSEKVSDNPQTINTKLSSGIYFVKVTDDIKEYVQKLIVE